MKNLLKGFVIKYRYIFRKHTKNIFIITLLIVITASLGSLYPFMIGMIIDSITENKVNETLMFLIANFLISATGAIFVRFEAMRSSYLALQIVNEIKENLFNRVLRMKKKDLDKYASSDVINRLENSIQGSVILITELIKNIVLVIVSSGIALYFMFNISISLTLGALVLFPITIVVTHMFRKAMHNVQQDFLRHQDRYLGFLYRTFEAIDGIKSFRVENSIARNFNSLINGFRKIYLSQVKIGANMTMSNEFVSALFNLVILYIAAILIWGGDITIGNLITFTLYLNMLAGSLATINTLHVMLQENSANLERLIEMESFMIEESSNNTNDIDIIESISATDLHFSYNGGTEVLSGLTFSINKPGWYSIIGENGVGKSTLFKLLLKFYDATDGQLMLNGLSIQKLTFNSIRKQVAYIAKTNFFINDTIENNLRMVNPLASENDIIHALKMVGLYGFIDTLEDGIKTVVGDNGLTLSSGQIQKLMLSRVFLVNASVILLDEVTSDIDSVSEYEIAKIIRAIAKEKIVISIAHRLSFVEPSDRVLLLLDGKVKFEGTYDELVEYEPRYSF